MLFAGILRPGSKVAITYSIEDCRAYICSLSIPYILFTVPGTRIIKCSAGCVLVKSRLLHNAKETELGEILNPRPVFRLEV